MAIYIGDTNVSGGEKLYQHRISFTVLNEQVEFDLILKTNTSLTRENLANWLYTNNFISANTDFYIEGIKVLPEINSSYMDVSESFRIYSSNGSTLKCSYKQIVYSVNIVEGVISFSQISNSTFSNDITTITDKVIEIK